MKKKVFSIFFALVLVCSFSLVTAVPVAADESVSTIGDVEATVTRTDTLDEVTFDIEILSESENVPHGVYGVGLVFATSLDQPAFQVWYAESAQIGAPNIGWWYQKWEGSAWGDCVPLEDSNTGITAIGDGASGEKIFTVTIPVAVLGGPGAVYSYAVQVRTNNIGWYPAAYDWGSDVSGFATATIPRPAEVWVAADGNDSDPGTEALPFATIQKGIDIVAKDGTVNVAAGTYDEALEIDKSLTLQGAGKADTVIDAGGAQYGISIRTAPLGGVLDSVAIKDLTVKNEHEFSRNIVFYTTTVINAVIEDVDLSGSSWAGLEVHHGTVNTLLVRGCTFENFKRHGVRVDTGSKVDHLTVIDSDFSTDEEPLIIDKVPSQSGIESCGNISNLTVSGSTFTGTVNGIRLFWYWADRVYSIDSVNIEGSTFEGTDAGFFFYASAVTTGTVPVGGYEIGDIQIHDCSFTDSNWGVNFDDTGMEEVYKDVVIDATYNWWGHASGPIRVGTNPLVSDNVLCEPWLLVEDGPTFDKTLALKDGWTLVSIDKAVADDSIWVGKELAYTYTPGGGYAEATPSDLEPVDALYVKTVGGGGVGINYSGGVPVASSKNLEAGWNLISSATIDNARNVLSPLRYIDVGDEQGVGLATLVSQGSYNQHTEGWYVDATIWENLSDKEMNPFDGYWVYMNAAKNFGVVPD
ncbi:hypothetical protein ES703_93739 [subsurface metagenome]